MQEQEIRIEACKAERILVYPYDFSEGDISEIFYHMKDMWGIEQIRMGIGSFISLDHVYEKNFSKYEGIYTTALNNKAVSNSFIKRKGKISVWLSERYVGQAAGHVSKNACLRRKK